MKATKSNFADLMAIARRKEAEREADSSTSPVTQTTLVKERRVVTQTSLVKNEVLGLSDRSPITQTSLVTETIPNQNLAAFSESQNFGKGHLRLNHDYFDKVLTKLDAHEQLLFIHLLRYRKGNSESTILLNFPLLIRRTRLSQSTLTRTLKSLEDKGLLIRESYFFGRGQQQGTVFRLVTPTGLNLENKGEKSERRVVTQTTPFKRIDLITHNTTENVCVCSRFTLAECRKYAESLRADGITNPGGYATKIHRSGEADDLVAKFLEPVAPEKPLDVSACPDCHGTGFYEPGGAGKGVARCKHERLSSLPAVEAKPRTRASG